MDSTSAPELSVGADAKVVHRHHDFPKQSCLNMSGLSCFKFGKLVLTTVYAVKFPSVLAQLGLKNSAISYVGIVSPIMKLGVAPGIAVLADSSFSRIPYVFTGTILFLVSSFLIGFSDDFSDDDIIDNDNITNGSLTTGSLESSVDPTGIAIAIISYIVFELGFILTTYQYHTIIAEVVPKEQPRANAFVGINGSLGLSLGFVLGAIGWGEMMPFLNLESSSEFFADVRGALLLAVIIMFTFFFVFLFMYSKVSKEKEKLQAGSKEETNDTVPVESTGSDSALKKEVPDRPDKKQNKKLSKCIHPAELFALPHSLRGVFLIRFLAAVAWENFIGYIALYLATDIYGGNPDDSLPEDDPGAIAYRDGQLYASQVLLGSQIAGICFAFFFPWLLRKMGLRNLYTFVEFMHLVIMLGITITRNKVVASIMGVFGGIPYAGAVMIPVTVVGNEMARSPMKHNGDGGRLMTMIYLAVALAQIISSIGGGLLVSAFDEQIAASFWGSIPFILAALIATRLVRLDDYDPSKSFEMESGKAKGNVKHASDAIILS